MPVKVLDCGLVSKAGHHYSFNKALVEADPSIEVYGFNNMSLEILDEGWAKPAFSHWLYVNASADPVTGALDSFLGLGEAFEHDLFHKVEINDDDTLLLHTANAPVLWGLSRYLRKTNKRPTVKFLHSLPGVKNAEGKLTENFVYYKKALADMALWGGKFDVGVLTEWLLPEAGALGVKATVVPPIAMNTVEVKQPVETPVFGFLGHANGVKGLQLLLEAANLDKEGKYLVQVNPESQILLDNVETIRGELSTDNYWIALARMDAIVLPYNGDYYREYTSGVFLEAICSGRPVIIPRDTWMEFEAKRQNIGYTTFKSGSTVELLAAIQEMRKNWVQNYEKSVTAIGNISQKYSVESFLKWVKTS